MDDLEQMADSPGFQRIRDQIIALARLRESDLLLDVGSGTGLLALAAGPHVKHVSALDASPEMCRHLAGKLKRLGIANVEVLQDTATDLPLPDAAVDVVLSNYCFHHLTDPDKVRALAEIERVLRPGGRLVFGDMMFRVSLATRRDRAVIWGLAKRMVAHGPAGLLRLARNAGRVAAAGGERPARADWWSEALHQAGFVDVSVRPLEHEGGIAFARKPA